MGLLPSSFPTLLRLACAELDFTRPLSPTRSVVHCYIHHHAEASVNQRNSASITHCHYLKMEGAEKFHHPYEPYDIQLQFMRALYDCIEQGKIGIFESPTGEQESESVMFHRYF